VTLTGTGIDFTLTANGPTSATLASGTSATYSLMASSLTGLSGTIALSCTGAPTNAICNINPASASLGGNTSVIVTVQTGVQARVDPPSLHLPPIAYALLLPAAFLLRRKRLRPLCALIFLLALGGCGPGRVNPEVIPPTGSNPTPSGTYNLTVTATTAGLTHTVGLTLIVR
jgi:hypothetical protein